jgi:microcin C transport system substrate-binding protein
MTKFYLLVIILFLISPNFSLANDSNISHGIAIFGDLKYPANFKNFDYVNPTAPKGGEVKIAQIGTFDSLNPFIIKGVSASGVEMIFDTLMKSSADEAAAEYGLIAQSVKIAKNGEWVIFKLRPEAKWHDGTQITADDVVFSFEIITTKGHPQYKSYYKDVKSAEKLADGRVKFTFSDTTNRELPLIIGQLPILSKAYYKKNDFEKGDLTPPLGSGAYKVKNVDSGRSITYERVKDYWANNLPINIGHNNFDSIRIDYYRDDTVTVEALKAGEYDFRRENIAKTWANAYNIEQVKDGRMIKEALEDGTPTGMQCFIFNTRRSNFSDIKVREALQYAYDFEWANKQLFYSAYTRNRSYFGNSEYEATGLPSSEELKLLEPFKGKIPDEVFNSEYNPPVSEGELGHRNNLLKAQKLLDDAGWVLKDMKRVNPHTGEPINIEFLITSTSFERVIAPFVHSLKKLGIESTIRTVDSSGYVKRRDEFDFDVMVNWFAQGPTPGNEQVNYWHSSVADTKGSQNLIGIKNEAVDFLVNKITSAKTKDELVTATKALDRILQWGYYAIPQWHSRTHRVIYWNKFGRPEKTPPYSLGFLETWWIDKDKKQKLEKLIAKE